VDDYYIDSIEKNFIDYFIDIGACVGEISIQVARSHPNAKIIAYEPCKDNYRILLKRIKDYPNIVAINEALGDGFDLYFYDMGRNDRHLFLADNNGGYKVKSKTLSDIFKLNNVDVSKRCLLKINCEGGEALLIDDQESADIIGSCFHVGIKIHFRHKKSGNTRLNIFPEWRIYNMWIHRNFYSNYDIIYWKSNKNKGYGIYILSKDVIKKKNTVFGKNKIFGIGLCRTGTKSISSAMAILGYKVNHAPRNLEEIQCQDFVSDITVACRYKFLDYVFENSKFILTVRGVDSWSNSVSNFDQARKEGQSRNLSDHESRFILFGGTVFEEKKYKEVYNKYYAEVLEYFKDRPNDLLVMNIIEGDGWEKLCGFLGKEIPDRLFPHEHKMIYIK